jgi:hypothetical protein
MKVSMVPLNPGEGGYYEETLVSGLITGTSAADPIFSLQWHDPDYDMILKSLIVRVLTTTAFAAAQLVDFKGWICRGFTGADSGGTDSKPSTLMQKLETRWPDSRLVSLGDLRIASTGTLTAGTRTPDTLPLFGAGFLSNAINTGILNPPFKYPDRDNMDLPAPRFKVHEGLIITLPTVLGATGVIKAWITLGWMEVKKAFMLEQ